MHAEDPHKQFLEYLAANQGKPIDAHVADEAKEELMKEDLAEGAKSGYAVYRDEADRRTIAASYPEGSLFRTDIPDNELSLAIEKLESARSMLIDNLTDDSIGGLLRDPKHVTVAKLGEKMAAIPQATKLALGTIKQYMDVDPETTLFDLPELMKEQILRLNVVRSHRESLAKSQDGK